MKRIIILAAAAAVCLLSATQAYAQFGVWQKAEWTKQTDPQTGITLNVLTDTLKNDKFLYQTDPMWTPDGKYLLFRSSSRGASEGEERVMPDGRKVRFSPTHVYFIEIATGRIIQATDDGLSGTGFLSNVSNKMYLSTGGRNQPWQMYVMDLDRLFKDAEKGKAKKASDYATLVGTFPQDLDIMPGSYCINSDDTYAYISCTREVSKEEMEAAEKAAFKPEENQPKKVGVGFSALAKMDLKTGEVTKITNVDFRMGHIQASRFRPNEIVFCLETGGDAYQRMWFCDAEKGEFKPLYNETPLDWVTHETFASEDYVYFNVLGWQDRLRKQVSGIFRINLRTDDVDCIGQVEMDKDRSSALTGRGFWHCNATRDNAWACGDTFAGSVWIMNVANGHRYQIASDTKMAPDHAQPFFSPDRKHLCFQSGHYSGGTRLNLVMVDLTSLPFYE